MERDADVRVLGQRGSGAVGSPGRYLHPPTAVNERRAPAREVNLEHEDVVTVDPPDPEGVFRVRVDAGLAVERRVGVPRRTRSTSRWTTGRSRAVITLRRE